MSVDNDTLTEAEQAPAPIVFAPRERRRRFARRPRGERPPRPRAKKLRLLFVVSAFLTLALISLLFGVLTSIASDLPELENTVQFRGNVDSYLYDDTGKPIGVLAPPTRSAIDSWSDISQNMVHAIVAVEDKRFWSDDGIDIRGLLRAAISDVTGGQYEGGSTIPEEFIKVVRQEENHRTVFEKLIEAGMAFQLTHKWSHMKILTEYLNTIYFGNGAVGIESAARVYFGWNHGYEASNPAGEGKSGCGDPDAEDPDRKECASVLYPWEAALLAGMVANPTEYDPVTNPGPAEARRNLVLKDMYQQHYIDHATYEKGINEPLPTAQEIQDPREPSAAPYFTSWVGPLIVRALEKEGVPAKTAQYQAYYGGLKVRLSLNLQMQAAAQAAINDEFPPGVKGNPTASLVAIDNKTGEVRAMVSGDGDYQQSPFNLATLGYRQPGSAFKIFTLAAALSTGDYGPDSVFDSKPLSIPYDDGKAHFVVHNFGNVYAGPVTLATATATSDNSVFTQLGMEPNVGTDKVAEYAHKLGIRSSVSTNPAMIIGGLTTGVSALDMAHAYETVANNGEKVYNPILGDIDEGPIGIDKISDCAECRQHTIANDPSGGLTTRQEITPEVASTIDELLHGPVDDSYGTGTAAAIPGVDVAGKTGTTSNYVDAWFVGWTPTMTVAVWVGYPNSGKAMLTNFDGGPVEGGTFPAIIWRNFMVNAIQIMDDEAAHKTTTYVNPSSTELTPDTYSATGTSTATQTTQTTATANTQQSAQTTSSSAATSTPPASSSTPAVPATTPPPAPSGSSTTGANGGSGL